ncbi:MAG: hypothetical protein EORIYHIE_001673 [Candidatus Fervidibacter sp.]
MFVQTLPQPAQRLLERMTGVTEKKCFSQARVKMSSFVKQEGHESTYHRDKLVGLEH